SGNTVMLQTLDVLRELFTAEQRLILAIVASRERDHKEHLGILDALERRDAALAVERMRNHIEGVVKAVQKWDPEDHPVDSGWRPLPSSSPARPPASAARWSKGSRP